MKNWIFLSISLMQCAFMLSMVNLTFSVHEIKKEKEKNRNKRKKKSCKREITEKGTWSNILMYTGITDGISKRGVVAGCIEKNFELAKMASSWGKKSAVATWHFNESDTTRYKKKNKKMLKSCRVSFLYFCQQKVQASRGNVFDRAQHLIDRDVL